MTCSQIFGIIGLLFDIAGVVLLFFYGIPPEVNPHGVSFELREGTDEAEKQKWSKYKFRSNIALLLLIIGFGFQLFSVIAQNR